MTDLITLNKEKICEKSVMTRHVQSATFFIFIYSTLDNQNLENLKKNKKRKNNRFFFEAKLDNNIKSLILQKNRTEENFIFLLDAFRCGTPMGASTEKQREISRKELGFCS